MKKYILDLCITECTHPHPRYSLIKATLPNAILPAMLPGQFVQLRIDGSKGTFLRRPISIHYVDEEKNEVWFLVQMVGEGTRSLGVLKPGSIVNCVLPLGRGFSIPSDSKTSCLLIGGGVGVAPLLYLGSKMIEVGCQPTFLLGARSKGDILQLDMFENLGPVFLSTEDGSVGEKGFVTQNSVLSKASFQRVYCCGPKPMMVAVAKYAKERGVDCEVSLENMMACGLGACLCCVEDAQKGNVCVCKDGPVFNIDELKWQI